MKNAAILWTGGKDSAMALHEAIQSGLRVQCLVTYAPPEPHFLAHPLTFIKKQALALALPHYVLPVTDPFEECYEAGLRWLQKEKGIDCVVTGDIAEVNGQPNWIRERSRSVDMKVYTLLWGRNRLALLRQIVDRGFKVRFSCVKTSSLNESWVGRGLDNEAIEELCAIRETNGLDLCGENGEYHTLTLNGPQFNHDVDICSFSIRVADSMAYMEIHESEL
jgi:diphthine-ammonia ligase